MATVIAKSRTGLETEDKYRLWCLPVKKYLVKPELISQGYFRFTDQEILEFSGRLHLQWKHGKKTWQTKIPHWVKKILKHSEKREFRIRRSEYEDGRVVYYGTVKSDGRLTRKEWQVRLRKELAELLWPFTEGCRIYKTRYTIDLPENRVIHLDAFEQCLDGLIIAEVESPNEESAAAYFAKGGPANLLGSCVLVTYDTRHRHRKLMEADSPPPFPVLFSATDKKALKM